MSLNAKNLDIVPPVPIGLGVQSSSNIGTGEGLALPRVVDDLPFKSIVAGVGISITPAANEIVIATLGGLQRTLYSATHKNDIPLDLEFFPISGVDKGKNIEVDKQTTFAVAMTLKNYTVVISVNTNLTPFNWNIRKNGLNGLGSILIPAGITGTFQDLVNTDSVIPGDLVDYQITGIGLSTVTVIASSLEAEFI